jgi:hypothetical protein
MLEIQFPMKSAALKSQASPTVTTVAKASQRLSIETVLDLSKMIPIAE